MHNCASLVYKLEHPFITLDINLVYILKLICHVLKRNFSLLKLFKQKF
jgi:hypothetical protein